MTTTLSVTGTSLSGARKGAPGSGIQSIPEKLVVLGVRVVFPEWSHGEAARFRHGKGKKYGDG